MNNPCSRTKWEFMNRISSAHELSWKSHLLFNNIHEPFTNTCMNVHSFLFTNIHELFITVHDHTWTHLRFGMEVIRNHQTIMETAKNHFMSHHPVTFKNKSRSFICNFKSWNQNSPSYRENIQTDDKVKMTLITDSASHSFLLWNMGNIGTGEHRYWGT